MSKRLLVRRASPASLALILALGLVFVAASAVGTSAAPRTAVRVAKPKPGFGLPMRWTGWVQALYKNPVVFSSYATVVFTLSSVDQGSMVGGAANITYRYRPSGSIKMHVSGSDGSCTHTGNRTMSIRPIDAYIDISFVKRSGHVPKTGYYTGTYQHNDEVMSVPTIDVCPGDQPREGKMSLLAWFDTFTGNANNSSPKFNLKAKRLEGTGTDAPVGAGHVGKWEWCLSRDPKHFLCALPEPLG